MSPFEIKKKQKFLTTQQAIDLLGIGKSTLFRWEEELKLPTRRESVGNQSQRRFTLDRINELAREKGIPEFKPGQVIKTKKGYYITITEDE